MADLSMLPPDFPAMFPPPGQQSNFDHPHSVAPRLIALNAVFVSLMLLVLGARLYVRVGMLHCLGPDDYFILLAAAGSIVHTGIMLNALHLGFGKHLWDIRARTFSADTIRTIIAIAIVYPVTILFLKVSIALLYKRAFGNTKTFRRTIWIYIAVCFAFYGAYFSTQVVTAVRCVNPFTITKIAICRHSDDLTVISGVFNVVTDVIILALPIPKILKLNMRGSKKLGLMVIFSCGAVACAVSFVRLILTVTHLTSPDTLYNAAVTGQMSIVEINAGIIATSMFMLPKLLQTPWAQASRAKFSTLWHNISGASSKVLPKDSGYSSRPPTSEQSQLVPQRHHHHHHHHQHQHPHQRDDGSDDGSSHSMQKLNSGSASHEVMTGEPPPHLPPVPRVADRSWFQP